MLKKMVLDISTDFLFGESIDAQTPEGGPAAERFLQALDESLAGWHKRRLAGLGSCI
ncbi:hypothetical protein M7I_3072 [Glarea lozoyensis 74030]|uniref:Uncharacterized protein n=1 Tax=Glarea lozoyensis (strain ATCC 74030 / MF5533) TaxID=1104152 RepID=H0EKH4_GLAL7|nr:hypothetical protein M7I_3072 [Glarea lozoyensis 74030]